MKYYLLLFAAFGLMSSCASLVGFEDGKTNGEENHTLTASASSIQSADFSESGSIFNEPEFYPNFELGWRYGMSDKFDLGLKANSFLNIAVNGKYQILGDRDSKFATSIGAEIGSFAFSGLYNIQAPLFLSYHPNPKLTWYATPRYVKQFGDIEENNDDVNVIYFGSSFGVLFGKRHKFGIDLGIHQFSSVDSDENPVIFNIGLGGKFYFGPTARR